MIEKGHPGCHSFLFYFISFCISGGLTASSWEIVSPANDACPSQFSFQSKPDSLRKPKLRSSGGQVMASHIAPELFPGVDVLGLADADTDCSVNFSAISQQARK